MKNTYKKIETFFQRFFTLDDTPNNIAAGAALGIFLGIVPGEGLATTLVITALIGINKASATIGVLATNMWGTIAVLPLATFIGGWVFRIDSARLASEFKATYNLGFKYFLSKAIFFDLALPLIVGFITSAGLIALVFYLIVYFLLKHKKAV
ncbi:MAG: hypothetical protein ACD_14C00032G0005 [uncultured bacterium]|nr:MAG: hypothetical protein ACD_14C00032G0005 [uncultured bacterium]